MNPAISNTLNDTSGAVGLEHVILQLQYRLSSLPWLQVVFGRAFTLSKSQQVEAEPNVYAGSGEYISSLPNDFFTSQSFFRSEGPERPGSVLLSTGRYQSTRNMALLVWLNLEELKHDSKRDDIYLETLKFEVMGKLRESEFVSEVYEYEDESPQAIFQGYDVEKIKPERLIYPYCGFRISFTVSFIKPC